jgi:hypothetical protein
VPKLGDMESPRIKHIAKGGHQQMRIHTAMKQGFPNPKECDSLCWEMLVKATKNDSILWRKMKEEIQKNGDIKGQPIDYVSVVSNAEHRINGV